MGVMKPLCNYNQGNQVIRLIMVQTILRGAGAPRPHKTQKAAL